MSYSDKDRENRFREIVRGLGELLKPKPRLNIWQWADAKRYLAKGVSQKSKEGPERYRSADAPHQRKPQESPLDPNVQMTIYVMASQIGGKTEMFNNILGYHMDHCPSDCIMMRPQLESAEKYSKKKFMPMVEATPCLSKLIKPARSRDSGNTILVKEFQGGSIFFVGANSPASLRGASGGVLLGDEVDSNKPNAEGDPIELLWKRGESFPNVVKVLASTPTLKGASIIWDFFEISDQQYWFVPCVKCGFYHVLKWSQVVWPEGQPEKSTLLCPSCAAALNDKERLEMYFNGEWRATAPFQGIAGYHLNGIYAPWPAQKGYANRLHQMAVEHIRACKKGDQAKQVWVNTFLCECWEVETEKIEPHKISERAEDYTPTRKPKKEGDNPSRGLPEQIIIILADVDVQKDRLECEMVGLGEDDESWGIEYKKFYGDTEQDDVWNDLANHLAGSNKYEREDGVWLPITATAIDMRHRPQKVRQFVQRSGVPRIFPVYGAGGNAPILVTTRFNKHYRLRTFAINTKLAKDTIFARLRMTAPGPRFMHYPTGQGYDKEYFLQLTAEVLRRKREKGIMIEFYEKIRDRNEALDIRVYFLALIDILKPNLTAIAKKLKPKPKGPDESDSGPKEYILNKPPGPKGPGKGDSKAPAEPPRQKVKVGGFKWGKF